MNEIEYDGNIFLLPKEPGDACLVTTNGMVRKDGKAVMGAGIAKYCRDNFAGVDRILGEKLKSHGNHVHYLGGIWTVTGGNVRFMLFSFPTKHDWKDGSDPELIRQSCREMMRLADAYKTGTVYMPCPGCSNGRLDYWTDVRPILERELDDRFTVCIPARIMGMKKDCP